VRAEFRVLGQIELAVSDAIMAETSLVLRDKFQVPPDDVQLLGEELLSFAVSVAPTETVDAVPGDPTDNRILECAVAAKSDVVVTGDGHLLSLGSYRGIRMVTPAAFLEEFQARAG
jgi:predicted nucleic acid-binding protein